MFKPGLKTVQSHSMQLCFWCASSAPRSVHLMRCSTVIVTELAVPVLYPAPQCQRTEVSRRGTTPDVMGSSGTKELSSQCHFTRCNVRQWPHAPDGRPRRLAAAALHPCSTSNSGTAHGDAGSGGWSGGLSNKIRPCIHSIPCICRSSLSCAQD